jgi:hypothetical protein
VRAFARAPLYVAITQARMHYLFPVNDSLPCPQDLISELRFAKITSELMLDERQHQTASLYVLFSWGHSYVCFARKHSLSLF